MPSLELHGATIYYEFDVTSDRPVLVLSNSLGTDLSMWTAQMEIFRQHFSVLRYDTRGHGRSSAPSGVYDVDMLGGDVIEMMDVLGIERAHFCGLSMGGMIGQWLGTHAPERLRRLVLSNTAAKIGTTEMWDQRIATVQRDGMQAIVPAVLKGWFTEAFHRTSPEVVERMGEMLRANDVGGYSANCAAVRDMDQRESVAAITVPTLVVYGTEDRSTPPSGAEFLLEQIMDSRPLKLHAAHISNIEAAEAFTDGVVRFLLEEHIDG